MLADVRWCGRGRRGTARVGAALLLATAVLWSPSLALGQRSSSLQRRFDLFSSHLQLRIRKYDPPTTVIGREVKANYARLFSPDQNPAELGHLSASDIRLLFHAAYLAQFDTSDTSYTRDMQLDLTELEHRHAAKADDYASMYDALIGSRMFVEARVLATAHPGTASIPAPTLRNTTDERSGPSILVVSDRGLQLTRRSVDLRTGAHIVVVTSPYCHFARHALPSLEGDPVLGPVFRRNAIWIVPPDDLPAEFAAIAAWNGAYPHAKMYPVYSQSDWPMLDRWETPSFYFLRDGQVRAEVIGWPAGGRKAAVAAALRKVKLLQ